MANDYMNLLRISGAKNQVDAFVGLAKTWRTSLTFENLRPPPEGMSDGPELERWKIENWGSPSPWPHMQPAERIVEFGTHIADYSFGTRGTPPFVLLEHLAGQHPDLILTLATFEENMMHAEVRVAHGEERFERILDADKLIDERDAGELNEDEVFDELKQVASEAIDRILGGPPTYRTP